MARLTRWTVQGEKRSRQLGASHRSLPTPNYAHSALSIQPSAFSNHSRLPPHHEVSPHPLLAPRPRLTVWARAREAERRSRHSALLRARLVDSPSRPGRLQRVHRRDKSALVSERESSLTRTKSTWLGSRPCRMRSPFLASVASLPLNRPLRCPETDLDTRNERAAKASPSSLTGRRFVNLHLPSSRALVAARAEKEKRVWGCSSTLATSPRPFVRPSASLPPSSRSELVCHPSFHPTRSRWPLIPSHSHSAPFPTMLSRSADSPAVADQRPDLHPRQAPRRRRLLFRLPRPRRLFASCLRPQKDSLPFRRPGPASAGRGGRIQALQEREPHPQFAPLPSLALKTVR